jgi:lysophospholipase L1-like esterase
MNTQFILAILFAVFILFSVSLWSVYYEKKYIEPFNQITNKNIILIGDSMLQNKLYVRNGKSITDILEKLTLHNTIFNYAVDGTTISGVYQQIKEIPIEFNNSNTSIFLSAGGNDIIDRAQSGSTNENIDSIFDDYCKMVQSLKTKMNESNIVLLTLYYPYSKDYHLYYGMIKDWNQKLEAFAKDEGLAILKTNNLLSQPTDFISNIEPSETGGVKIAKSILAFC